MRALAVSASLLAAFAGIGLAISTVVRNPARVTTYVVLAWALGVALLDFGLIGVLLRWRVDAHAVFTLAVTNSAPVSAIALPNRSETVLMEGFRQVDEWPLIRKSIPGYAITFHKLEDLEKLDAGEKAQGEQELDFDDAFAEFESGQSSQRTGRLKERGSPTQPVATA